MTWKTETLHRCASCLFWCRSLESGKTGMDLDWCHKSCTFILLPSDLINIDVCGCKAPVGGVILRNSCVNGEPSPWCGEQQRAHFNIASQVAANFGCWHAAGWITYNVAFATKSHAQTFSGWAPSSPPSKGHSWVTDPSYSLSSAATGSVIQVHWVMLWDWGDRKPEELTEINRSKDTCSSSPILTRSSVWTCQHLDKWRKKKSCFKDWEKATYRQRWIPHEQCVFICEN